jgi:hypothetical protein
MYSLCRVSVVTLLFGLSLLQSALAQGEHFTGHFVTTNGKTQVVGEFSNLEDDFDVEHNGNDIDIKINKIKEVFRVEKTDGSQHPFIVILRNGNKFKVNTSFGYLFDTEAGGDDFLSYTFFDRINGKYSEDIIYEYNVKKIVFDEDYGELRRCPKDGKTFPPDYLFCPYDKTKMDLVKIGQ